MAYDFKRNSDRYHLDIGSGVQIPMSNSDLAFNIGSMLGGLWAKNYNDRGAAKAEQKARDLLNGTEAQPPSSLTEAAQQGMQNANAQPVLSGQQLQNVNAQLGFPALQQPEKMTDIINIGGQKANAVNPTLPKDSTNSSSANTQAPERDLKAEKLDYVYKKYNNGSANPDGDTTAANKTADIMRMNIGGMDFSKLPSYKVEDIEKALRSELAKDGRNEYQINKALENISPLLREKVQAGNDARVADLRKQLDEQISRGNLDDMNVTLAQIAKIDPAYAKAMGNKVNRAWDKYNAQEKLNQTIGLYKSIGLNDKQARNYALTKSIFNPVELYNMQQQEREAARAARYSGGGGRGRGSESGLFAGTDFAKLIGSKQYENAAKRIAELTELYGPKMEGASEAAKQEFMGLSNWKRAVDEGAYGYRFAMPQAQAADGGNAPGQAAKEPDFANPGVFNSFISNVDVDDRVNAARDLYEAGKIPESFVQQVEDNDPTIQRERYMAQNKKWGEKGYTHHPFLNMATKGNVYTGTDKGPLETFLDWVRGK